MIYFKAGSYNKSNFMFFAGLAIEKYIARCFMVTVRHNPVELND